jgi:hypothetical protein
VSDRIPTGPPAPRWATVGLPLVLAALAALAAVAYLAVATPAGPGGRSAATPSDGIPVPSAELAGEWSGEGRVTQCAGFDRCDGTRTVTLTIDCSGKRCEVVPFDPSYGSPPLRFVGGRYRAIGPLPLAVAPTCGGAPTSTARWRLDLAVRSGRLTGSYAESTVQSFDCGATGLRWDVVLHRV